VSRTQRELKALRQQQREEAAARQRARERRNLFIIAGVLVTAAVAILLVALALNQAANQAAKQAAANRLPFKAVSGTIGTAVPDEGRAHVDPSTTPTYKFYPPASGPHYSATGVAPVPWQTIATSTSPLVEGQYIHNLEHGGMAILYNCSTGADCTTLKNSLENYVTNLAPVEPTFNEVKVVITPYSQGMQKKVALVAWDYIEFLDTYDQNAITQFYENHVDKGPEAIP
jgi:cytoskeletal protein RodZ